MILSLAMSPDGRFMASGDEDGTIMMWDLSTGRCVTPLIGHTSCVWTLAFRWIKEKFPPTPHPWLLLSLDVDINNPPIFVAFHFSCEGSLLASGSADCTVKLWDVTSSTKAPRTDEK